MLVTALLARPIFGWWNAQAIEPDTIASGAHIAQAWGMGSTESFMPYWVGEDGSISIHPMFFAGFVEGGIVGAAFRAILVVPFVWAAVIVRGHYSAPVMLVCISGSWDVLFSPWAGSRAVTIASAAFLAGYAIAT